MRGEGGYARETEGRVILLGVGGCCGRLPSDGVLGVKEKRERGSRARVSGGGS